MTKQYSTVGILGLYEVIEKFGMTKTDEFGNVSYTDEGIEFASKIFEVINSVKDEFTDEYSFNIESVPAERAAVVLCQKDNIIYNEGDKFIYSNQWIPLSAKCTIQEKLRLSAVLDAKCSGGAIAHINLESNFPNTDTAWKMLNKIAQSGVIYFAFNTRINECEDHHGFVGTDICPTCGNAPERHMKEYGHPAMFPENLAERVLKLFSFKGDTVLDPFNGAGTTTVVAKRLGRKYLGIDVSPEYCETAEQRICGVDA